jgi:hypothetical protein
VVSGITRDQMLIMCRQRRRMQGRKDRAEKRRALMMIKKPEMKNLGRDGEGSSVLGKDIGTDSPSTNHVSRRAVA